MISLITYYLTNFLWILAMPFIYWFGHLPWFVELMCIVNEIVDTVGIFFFSIILFISVFFIRNFLFILFNRKFFKNNFKNINNLSLITYINFFFSNLLKLITLFINSFLFFFKKK